MGTCETCGNGYDKRFTIPRGDRSAVFDSSDPAAPGDGPAMRLLGVPHPRPRRRSRRVDVLLRALRPQRRAFRAGGPGGRMSYSEGLW